jgi:hypothetical protein
MSSFLKDFSQRLTAGKQILAPHPMKRQLEAPLEKSGHFPSTILCVATCEGNLSLAMKLDSKEHPDFISHHFAGRIGPFFL